MRCSILILTLNEEANITACLEALKGFDDIVVFDSHSSDGTVKAAEALGARIVQRKFDNWSSHQNWAVRNIEFKHPWVFYLDADERMTPELAKEVEAITSGERSESAFYCSRDNFFMGRKIGRVYPPVPIVRLFRPQKIQWERLVNPVAVVDGPIGWVRHRFIHYNFSKGLTEWFDKHNKYSLAEAMEGRRVLKAGEVSFGALFRGDKADRRNALKRLSFKLPARGFLKFCYLYFARLGFLDGYPGFLYSVMQGMYEQMIALKMKELERRDRGLVI